MTVQTRFVEYRHGDLILQAKMAWDASIGAGPAILVAPTWAGRTNFEGQIAQELAELGYVGFAIDMYGKGVVGNDVEECSELMMPLMSNRVLLQERIGAAVETVRSQPEAVLAPIAAVGFCFGGLCVLDLARSRNDIAGVVSFHGLLAAPDNIAVSNISAKVLALHGYDDPMVRPEDVRGFCDEMTKAGCDWQLHAYGKTKHAFAIPHANEHELGTVYNEVAAGRAFDSMRVFFADALMTE